MRRTDREIRDNETIFQIIKKSYCCRLGLIDEDKVYIVPLNFGEIINEDHIILYFHSAKDGRKIELIKKNPNVGFELDTNYQIKESDVACNYTAYYQSVIGEGKIEIVEDRTEKIIGLNAIMNHLTGKDWEYNEVMVNTVCVLKLTVETMRGKQHID